MSSLFGNLPGAASKTARELASRVTTSYPARAAIELGERVAESEAARATVSNVARSDAALAARGKFLEIVENGEKQTRRIVGIANENVVNVSSDVGGKIREFAKRLEEEGVQKMSKDTQSSIVDSIRKKTISVTERIKEETINVVCTKLQKENAVLSQNLIHSINLVTNLISLPIKIRLLDILSNIITYNNNKISDYSQNDTLFYRSLRTFEGNTSVTTENYPSIYTNLIMTGLISFNDNRIEELGSIDIRTLKIITNNHIELYNILLEVVKNTLIRSNNLLINISEDKSNEENVNLMNYLVDQLEILRQVFFNSEHLPINIKHIIEDPPLSIEDPSQGGGKYQAKKMNKKDILGKERCIYKKQGDKREYVKYKSQLITVKDFKIIMAKKNKVKAK
jgi:hypothetical protein